MSLDGYIAKKDGSVAWLDKYNKTGFDYGYEKFYKSVNSIIVGNTTHKQFPQEHKGKDCFVFSRTPQETKEGIQFFKGTPKSFMEKFNLKGKTWLLGGANLLSQFLKDDLVDEFIITVMPELLGEGILLFEEHSPIEKLILVEAKPYGSVVQLHYKKY